MNKKRYLMIVGFIAVVVLLLASSCMVDNYSPVIDSLDAGVDWVIPSHSLQVTCNASDRDGDELSYDWSASEGNITGTGSTVTWTAPGEVGIGEITVVVDDGQGGSDTDSLILFAANGTLPIIEDMVVTAREPKYLKETSYGYKVGKGKEYDIECVASNTSGELIYEWLCDGGEISGEGSIITWTAPDIATIVTIMVAVFDTADHMDNDSIVFSVVSCTTCEFG
jgi:hypothetical protein